MKKNQQKIWFWVSLLMFVIPEILFSFVILSGFSFSKIPFDPLIYKFVNAQFFSGHLYYVWISITTECLGLLGLLILSLQQHKKIAASVIGIILVWLIFWFYVMYSFAHIQLW